MNKIMVCRSANLVKSCKHVSQKLSHIFLVSYPLFKAFFTHILTPCVAVCNIIMQMNSCFEKKLEIKILNLDNTNPKISSHPFFE